MTMPRVAYWLYRLAAALSPPPPTWLRKPDTYQAPDTYARERAAQDVTNAAKAREIAYLARLDVLERREIQCRDDEAAIERARQDIAREHKVLKAGFTKLKNARVLVNRDRARIRIMDEEIAREIERLHKKAPHAS